MNSFSVPSAKRRPLRRQGQGRRRAALLVYLHQKPQVVVAGRVPGDDQKVLVLIKIPAVFHAARRAEIFRLDAVFQLHTEVGHDFPGPVVQRRADVRVAVLAQQLHNMLHHRPAQKRHHGFGVFPRYRAQPRPKPARKDHCLHKSSSRVNILSVLLRTARIL